MALDTQLTQIQSVGISSNTVLTGITTVTTLNVTNAVVSGILTASLVGNVTGNTTGTHIGNVTGNLTGNVTGAVSGNVTGNVVGNVTAGSITINAANNTISGISTVGITTAYISNVQTNAIQTIAGKPILNSTGSILQVVQSTDTTDRTASTTSWTDTGHSLSITPSSSSSKILVQCVFDCSITNDGNAAFYENLGAFAIVRNSTRLQEKECGMNITNSAVVRGWKSNVILQYLDSPATTSATTYKTQFIVGSTSFRIYLNQALLYASSLTEANCFSTITLYEVSA